MTKELALQTIQGIYGALRTIPVCGEEHMTAMLGSINALKDISGWINGLPEKDEDEEVIVGGGMHT